MRIFARKDRSSGSVLLELLWTLPLFIAGVLLIALVGIQLNARSALRDAISSGLTLGAVRGSHPPDEPGLLAAIDDYRSTGGAFTPLRRLFVSPDLQDLPDDDLTARFTNTFLFTPSGPLSLERIFTEAPTPQLYALAYVQQGLRLQSLGDASFPCNPDGPLESGCLRCFFTRPEGATSSSSSSSSSRLSASASHAGDADANLLSFAEGASADTQMVLSCEYQIKNTFLSGLINIARALGLDLQSELGLIRWQGSVDNNAG